jgi:hypothetical protein
MDVAVAGTSVWLRTDAGAVRVDAQTGKVSPPVTVPRSIGLIEHLTVAQGALWAGVQPSGSGSSSPGAVYRFDASTGKPIGTAIKLPARLEAIGAGAGAVWVVTGTRLIRIDPSTGVARTEPATVPDGSSAVAVGGGSVWIPNHDTPGRVFRIDASTGRPTGAPIKVGGNPNDITADDRSVWTGDDNKGATEIDAATGKIVTTITLPGDANGLAIDGPNLWVTIGTNLAETVTRFSGGQQNTPPGLHTSDYAYGVAVGAGATWITSGATLLRIPG